MKKSWRNNVEFYLIGLLLLMVIAFSIAMPNIFWSVSNFQSIASQMPVLGILALAMAMTMLCGGINLSIIATANACSLVMAWVATSYPPGGATALATLLGGDDHWPVQRDIDRRDPRFADPGYPWHDDPAQRDKYSDHRRQRHR